MHKVSVKKAHYIFVRGCRPDYDRNLDASIAPEHTLVNGDRFFAIEDGSWLCPLECLSKIHIVDQDE